MRREGKAKTKGLGWDRKECYDRDGNGSKKRLGRKGRKVTGRKEGNGC